MYSDQVAFLQCDTDGKVVEFNEVAVNLFGGFEKLRAHFNTGHYQHLFKQLSSSMEPYVESFKINESDYELIIVPYTVHGYTGFNILIKTADLWQRWAEGDPNIRSMVQEVIDCIADGIIVVDADGYVRQTNNSYELMVEIDKEEYKDKHVDLLKDKGYTHASLTPMVVKQGGPVTIVDVRNNKDLLLTGVPIRDNRNKIIGVICNVRDVSELQELKRKLDESKKNERLIREQLIKYSQEQLDKGIITNNKVMKEIYQLAIKVAPTDTSVLITGESGVGKGVLARLIHRHSRRADKPFITVNCGAIPETLIESELFGYEAGAFTGASKSGKKGLFELANNGTIFLDEIGELPLNMQVKLLQTLQDGTVRRIGGKKDIKLDIRVISATNRDLNEMVAAKTFRKDLYYRLKVVPIHLPPLRERKEDIIPLALTFLEQQNKKYAINKRFSTDLMRNFLSYQWPGNIRELENVVERLVVTSSGEEIMMSDFFEVEHMQGIESQPLKKTLEDIEKAILEGTYRRMKSTRKSAAVLGISQSAFVKKAKKYGISLTKGSSDK